MSRKAKIVRNNLFYSEEDFLFDQEIAMDYISQDINQTILLFRVDRIKTNVDDIYGETTSDGVVYKDPIELNVMYLIEGSKNKAHDTKQSLARYQQIGNLKITVFEKTLMDNNVDISYGDYVGVQVTPDQMEYFVVSNDGKINFDNKHTLFGYKTLYRSVECVPVDKSEFNGI